MQKPLVSIGLLTYNHGKYVADALEGILSQEYGPLEIIILDDASCDSTPLIIEQYISRMRKRFTRVVYLKNEKNCGVISQNCNCIIKEAHGEFYYEVSGDDIILPHAVQFLYETFQKHPECSVVHANMVEIDDTYVVGDKIDFRNMTVIGRESGIEPNNLFQKLMCGNCISAPAVMLRRELFSKYGYHDENIIYEDYEYWLRISRTEKFYFLNEPIVLYRRSEVSVTNFKSKESHIKIQQAMDAVFLVRQKYINQLNKDEQIKCWQASFSFYFRLCAQNQYEAGMDWLEARAREMGLSKDEYRTECEKGKKIEEKEKRIFKFWKKIENRTDLLGDYLRKKNILSVAIYGYSLLGRMLQQELLDSRICVKYIIDRKGDLLVCQLPVFTIKDALPPVDAVIVAPVGLYETIGPQLNERINAKIIDLAQMIDDLELLLESD